MVVWTHTVCSRGLDVDVHGQNGQRLPVGLGSKHDISPVLIDVLRRSIVGER